MKQEGKGRQEEAGPGGLSLRKPLALAHSRIHTYCLVIENWGRNAVLASDPLELAVGEFGQILLQGQVLFAGDSLNNRSKKITRYT